MRHFGHQCAVALLVIGTAVTAHAQNAAPATPNHTNPARTAAPQVEKAEESNVDYFWRKSDEAFHAGDYERAIGWHKAIVALDPGDIESYSVAAWLMWSLGHGDEATQFIQRGLKANPTNWEMWDVAGQQYDLQKKLPDAQDAYTHAVPLLPKAEDSQMLRRRLAHAAERNGDLTTSVQTWASLAQDFPNEAVNKNNLARIKQRLEAAPANSPAALK